MGIDHGVRRLARGMAVIIAAVCVLAAMPTDVGIAPATGPMPSVADMTSWLGTSGIRIPALSVGTNTVTLLWPTPVDSRGVDSQVVRDYHIYENGRFPAQSSANTHTPAYGYIHAFATDPSHARAQPIAMHTYVVDALRPSASYRCSVQAVSSTGSVFSVGSSVTVRTKALSKVLDVSDFEAVGDGKTLDTAAIKRAVDACSSDCTVLLPHGRTFVSGPLTSAREHDV